MKFLDAKDIIDNVICEDFENNGKLESMLNYFEYISKNDEQDFNEILFYMCEELDNITKTIDKFLFSYYNKQINFEMFHTGMLLNFQDRLFNNIFDGSQIFYHLNTFLESQIYRNLSTPPALLSRIYCLRKESSFTISEGRRIMEEELQPIIQKNAYEPMINNINNEY